MDNMAIVRYKPGQTLTLLPLEVEVTVKHNTLAAGGVNYDEAVVTVAKKTGELVSVPVAIQDDYLTTRKPAPRRRWLLGQKATR